ncbi:hypothetical protein E3N88_19204 [Mikania micrantha]|uniref:DC1 domain-containing protein n=1 Tax=Mikania micrantha TaxID=192012 RepID=A0A5N6NQ90_9ASTR|nr:hypothetical protein E3N88_19204 [Mikania micrantha]
MDQGYKHFSHLHNLIKHELPEGVDVSCSGCHASATGTVYVCWSCNFYLHDQCYQATRSMKHPSHPPHPLTLVPYPTYHSNSFYCNSCQVIGTGFSYSCADCEFDLHVQCAYSITQAASFKHSHQFQELVPSGWNGMHNSNIDYHVPFFSTPDQSPPIPFAGVQYHSTSYDLSYGSIPPVTTQDPSMVHSVASVSIPMSSQNQIASSQYPSMGQIRPFSAPNPENQIPGVQESSMHLNRPSASIPTGTRYPQTEPSVSIPTSYPLNTIPSSQDPLPGPPVSIPTSSQDLVASTQVTLQEDEEDEVICSGCEETLVGNGYSCVEPDCNFHLHESCFHLKKEIHHKSHPEHPLTLLPQAPYNNKDGEFTCNACFSDGTGFTYHCSICKFDLHVLCVSLPETMKRDDHEHMLKLLYPCPVKHKEHMFTCDVCHGEVQKDRWAYYCESCDYGTHLGCVDCEVCERDSILDTQAQLQRLQLQMEMARQQAQFMANMGSSLANLAG